MTERYGKCDRCKGRGHVVLKEDVVQVTYHDLDTIKQHLGVDSPSLILDVHTIVTVECSRCGGTGFSGDAGKRAW